MHDGRTGAHQKDCLGFSLVLRNPATNASMYNDDAHSQRHTSAHVAQNQEPTD